MTSPEVSALVVLRTSGTPQQLTAQQLPDVAPDAEVVDAVRAWFSEHGFAVGPYVGISFSATAEPQVFRDQLGVDPEGAARSGGELDVDRSRLSAPVAAAVDAVLFTSPPDFGPGNP